MSDKDIEFETHPYAQFLAERYGAYRNWVKSEGLPVLSGSHVRDVRTADLGWSDRLGGRASLLSFSDQLLVDGYICEIGPGSKLNPQRHLYEEIVLIAEGTGFTRVWHDEARAVEFEWKQGALFAIPANAWFQHINLDADKPVRTFSLTSAPVIFELFRDPSFIFSVDHTFRDRFDDTDPAFFMRAAQYQKQYYGGILISNFIPDIRDIELVARDKRGQGTRNMYIHLAGSSMFAHVSQFPMGTYKKAHRHGPGAHIYVLDSSGYSLMWVDGEEPQRYDWQEGSVLSPPAGTWHQHFNTGPQPCRFVAFHASPAVQQGDSNLEQIDFPDEDPEIGRLYQRECEKNLVAVAMPLRGAAK